MSIKNGHWIQGAFQSFPTILKRWIWNRGKVEAWGWLSKISTVEPVQNLKVYFLWLSTVPVILEQEQHQGLSLETFPFLSFMRGQPWGDTCEALGQAWPEKTPGARGPQEQKTVGQNQEKGQGSLLEAQVPNQIQNWIPPGRGNESKMLKFLRRLHGNAGGRVRRGWGIASSNLRFFIFYGRK